MRNLSQSLIPGREKSVATSEDRSVGKFAALGLEEETVAEIVAFASSRGVAMPGIKTSSTWLRKDGRPMVGIVTGEGWRRGIYLESF